MTLNKAVSAFLFLFVSIICSSQPKSDSPVAPLRIPLFLTGNFGELRANHFHSGLDFKTQSKIGFPVYAFDDGYVSRVMVTAYGNGNALYINHPNGLTTVYLHLDHFATSMDAIVENLQYKDEKFEVNHYFKENEVKVSKGEVVAFSGNSGSSAGPHLHFEVRDTKTEEVFDPIFYFRNLIKDHIAPQARQVVIYPIHYGGVINGKMQKSFLQVANKTLRQVPEVWGKIALGLKAFDTKDGVSNVYGVKSVKLFVDNELIFSSKVNRYAFKNTRYINSCIDYAEWRRSRSTVLKSFVDPGNKIEIFENVKNSGIITINEERDYKIKYLMTDEYENSSELNFTLRGKKQAIPAVEIDCKNKLFCSQKSSFKTAKVHFDLPAGVLYDDLCFNYSAVPSASFYSDIHTLHNPEVPINDFCSLEIKLDVDTLKDKSKYYLARLTGKSPVYQKSQYAKGWMKGVMREFGDYTVAADFKAPSIMPLKLALSQNRIEFRIGDQGSGVASYKCTIDNQFALFSFDSKRGVIFCKLSPKHVLPKQNHLLKLVVRDFCQNETVFEEQFYW